MSAPQPTRPRRPIFITAALAAIAALGVSSCSAHMLHSASPASSAPAAPANARRAEMTRGTVSAENASTWTVTSAKGVAYTIDITPTTKFGTKQAPASAQSFPVGSPVVVTGQPNGTTIDAARIAAPANGGKASTAPRPTG